VWNNPVQSIVALTDGVICHFIESNGRKNRMQNPDPSRGGYIPPEKTNPHGMPPVEHTRPMGVPVPRPRPAAPHAQRPPRRRRSASPFAGLMHSLPFPRLSRRQGRAVNTWITIGGVAGAFVGCLAISVLFGVTLRAAVVSARPFAEDYGQPTASPDPNTTPIPELATPALLGGWQGTERVTVLVMGVDTRPEERGYRTRTDTMILMSADPVAHTASMLSIPRDMYVDVPGYGLDRINTAYPLGGAELAIETVQYNLGVRIDYYAVVEFGAFITLVDEIGGIDIYVPITIDDPLYPSEDYGYDPFYLPAGDHHLDGRTALKYARTRHQDNDYERARRQQAVILAIRDKITSLDMLPTLIDRAPTLYATMGESIRTNMTMEQMIDLALLANDIPEENIRHGVIDSTYLMGYETPAGAQVSIPNRSALGPYLEHIFWLDQ
jgi:LCP family protein required for cell wall assembly